MNTRSEYDLIRPITITIKISDLYRDETYPSESNHFRNGQRLLFDGKFSAIAVAPSLLPLGE